MAIHSLPAGADVSPGGRHSARGGRNMSEEKTILIVDDDPDIVESTDVVLQSAGYKVMTASNGTEALEKIEKQAPDLILLDIMMAEPTEGFHLSYKLRDDPVYSKIPIIVVSGISEKTGFNFSEEKGSDYIKADDFLDKPVNPQTLLTKIATLLEKKKSGGC
jgi:CheY-like chemotaxis protein